MQEQCSTASSTQFQSIMCRYTKEKGDIGIKLDVSMYMCMDGRKEIDCFTLHREKCLIIVQMMMMTLLYGLVWYMMYVQRNINKAFEKSLD